MKKSNFLTLNVNDAVKGLIMLVITTIVTGIFELLKNGTVFTWETIKPVLLSALTAAVAYIIKNWLSNSQGEFLKTENSPLALKAKLDHGNPMTKIIILGIILSGIGITSNAQGMFHKVTPAIFKIDKVTSFSNGSTMLTGVWKWRIDGTFVLDENVYHKDIKAWVSSPFSAVGPAVGYQHYVPASSIDPTPVNNYGVSAGVALGTDILKPDFSSVKLVLQGNIWQYLKGGFTFTLNNRNWFGYFLGTGITF
jgi:hypothetical protein